MGDKQSPHQRQADLPPYRLHGDRLHSLPARILRIVALFTLQPLCNLHLITISAHRLSLNIDMFSGWTSPTQLLSIFFYPSFPWTYNPCMCLHEDNMMQALIKKISRSHDSSPAVHRPAKAHLALRTTATAFQPTDAPCVSPCRLSTHGNARPNNGCGPAP